MTPRPRILLLGDLVHAKAEWNALSSVAELVASSASNRAEFLQEARSGALDNVVAAYRTVESVEQTGIWDQELAGALPPTFRFICHNGAGYDQLRPQELETARPGLPLLATNTPTAVDDATADAAFFLLLAALRNFFPLSRSVRQGQWRGTPVAALGRDPRGKTLGVLGMGGIGGSLARKAQAFGMKVNYHNRNQLPQEKAAGAQYVSFEELLATSDVLSIHVPLSPATRHLISAEQFGTMKKGIVIVNTARGAIIDEAELVKALDDGTVSSAGLDVFEQEPKIHPGLLDNDRCFLLPHVGTYTEDTQYKMELWAIENVRKAVEGQYSDMSFISEHKAVAKRVLTEGVVTNGFA